MFLIVFSRSDLVEIYEMSTFGLKSKAGYVCVGIYIYIPLTITCYLANRLTRYIWKFGVYWRLIISYIICVYMRVNCTCKIWFLYWFFFFLILKRILYICFRNAADRRCRVETHNRQTLQHSIRGGFQSKNIVVIIFRNTFDESICIRRIAIEKLFDSFDNNNNYDVN